MTLTDEKHIKELETKIEELEAKQDLMLEAVKTALPCAEDGHMQMVLALLNGVVAAAQEGE